MPLLIAGFVIMFFVIGGGIDSVSVFLHALAESEGWPLKTLSSGIALGAVTAALSTPLVGMAVDRSGVRLPMSVGCGFLAGGFLILAFMNQPWHFVTANLLLGPGFAACALLPITIAVTVLVPGRTALALGIVSAGSSLGAMVIAPAAQLMVEAFGWRTAYISMGALVVLAPIPCLLFAIPKGRLRARSTEPAQETEKAPVGLREELRRPGVLLLLGILALPGLATFGVQIHVVPLLADLGHSDRLAAGALGAVLATSGLGKVGGGLVGDRLGPIRTLQFALGLELVAFVLLLAATSLPMAGLFVLFHGLAVGTQVAVVPVIALSILGRARFATLWGVLQLGAMLMIGLAPVVPGFIFDATGSYQAAIIFWLGALAVGLLLALRLGSLRNVARG
ncbi:MAG: MFS transporter [bacterium]|nr:MFS transporter [bacterium]